jgi:hypothetical protein
MFGPVILSHLGQANFDKRYDFDTDGAIDVGDILMFAPVILTQCR